MDLTTRKSLKSNVSSKNSCTPRRICSGESGVEDETPILLEQDHHYHPPEDLVSNNFQPHSAPSSFMTTTSSSNCPSPRGEVIVKIDDGDPKSAAGAGKPFRGNSLEFWKNTNDDVRNSSNNNNFKLREKSFDFQHQATMKNAGNNDNNNNNRDDPPSKLIGNFLKNQQLYGDMSLDMDLEMDELQYDGGHHHRNLPPVGESQSVGNYSREIKVSFEEPPSSTAASGDDLADSVRRRFKDNNAAAAVDEFPKPPPHHDRRASNQIQNNFAGDGEVVRCTSNASFDRNLSLQRKSGLLRAKTRSRLIDPPDEPDRRSGFQKSGQLFSGLQGGGGKKGDNDEEDDPFLEEDLPDEFKKTQFSLVILLEWLFLILIVAALITSLCIPFLRDKKLWKLKLWKWMVLVLVLICGRLVSDWVIRIAVFCIERNFLLRKRVLYFVYGVKKAVQNCLWLGLVLTAWRFLFDQRVHTETRNDFLEYVTKILFCFVVGTLVWLVKTLMVKVLASSFHVSTYFDRIQESLFNQFVIETLSGPPLVELRRQEEEEDKLAEEVQKLQNAGVTIPPDLRASAFASIRSTRVTKSGMLQRSPMLKSGKFSRPLSKKSSSDDGISMDYLHKLNPKNVSAWNMKRLMNMVRHGALSTLDEQILDASNDDDKTTKIRSENEAKVAAKKIFQNVARRGSRFIYLEDLLRFMREDEAIKTTTLFEGATETGKISKSSLKNWVVNAFRERRALALTLNDTKTAVNQLHRMLNFLVAIIILVIWLLILEIATSKFLLFVSSQLVLVAFIFGNTCKTVYLWPSHFVYVVKHYRI